MKQFAYLMAIAIIGVAFTGCKDKNDPKNEGENNYNGENVRTQFTINFPTKVGNTAKRMPSASVQLDGAAFLGMDNIILIPFAGNSATPPVASTDNRMGGLITLPAIGTDPANSVSTLAANNNSKVYRDVSIPLGTASFLFYGHAMNKVLGDDKETGYTFNDWFQYGSLIVSGADSNTPAGISFNLRQINATVPSSAVATALINYLNAIANATDGTRAWKLGGAEQAQGWIDMYNQFIEMKAGSSASIQALVQDLYTEVKDRPAAIAVAIKNAILTKATDGGTGVLTFDPSICGYPQHVHLPDGAAAVKWNATSESFATNTDPVQWDAANSGATGKLEVASLTQYVYPAPLYYYVNSTLKASEDIQSTHYGDYLYWNDPSNPNQSIINQLYGGTTPTVVQGSTRSVAIVDPIQYAVARMDLFVKANASTIKDQKEDNISIGTGLTVTAVLVGGQGEVPFNFTPTAAGNFVVYDSIMSTPSNTIGTAYSANPINYTMLLESKINEKVRVAVEFVNNLGRDFYGVNGQIIPAGTKFYILAELDPANATDNHDNALGNVFRQDFATIVKLNLKTLQNAYNVLPDLRSPQLELGFSVDLDWQDGKEFQIDIE